MIQTAVHPSMKRTKVVTSVTKIMAEVEATTQYTIIIYRLFEGE